MAGKKENIKALFSNTRTRVIILFTIILVVVSITIGFLKVTGIAKVSDNASGNIQKVPTGIKSIPGSLDQTAQYAALQQKQNEDQAELAQKKGSSAIPTIIKTQAFGEGVDLVGPQYGEGGAGFITLSRSNLGGPEKSLWIQTLQTEQCSMAAIKEIADKGATLQDLREECNCCQLRQYGYTLSDLDPVCACRELKAAGFTAREMKVAGYTVAKLNRCGFSACEVKGAGFSAEDMKEGGFSNDELKGAGFSEAAIEAASGLPVGVSIEDVQDAGCDPEKLANLRERGVSAAAIQRISACSWEQLKAAGYGAAELKRAGASAADLKAAGFDPSELKRAGFNPRELLSTGFTPKDLTDSGFSADQVEAGQDALPPGVTRAQLKKAGCSVETLKRERLAGVSAKSIQQASGCSLDQLKAAGFSMESLRYAGFKPEDIESAKIPDEAASLSANDEAATRAAGCDPEKLKALRAQGVTAKQIRDLNGCSAAQLKAAGYTAQELADAGFTPAELLAAGFDSGALNNAGLVPVATIAAGRVKGCSVAELKAARKLGVSATTIKQTLGCSAAAMKAAGYTAQELRDAGFTAKELLDAGFDPQALKEAGYAADDLKDAGLKDAQLKALGLEIKPKEKAPTEKEKNATDKTPEQEDKSQSSVTRIPSLESKQSKVAKEEKSDTKELQDLLARQQSHMSDQRYQAKIKQLSGRMANAAGTALQGWKNVSTQVYIAGSEKDDDKKGELGSEGLARAQSPAPQQDNEDEMMMKPKSIFIKTGDILFAVLDTSVNTDEPGPILATIVSGKLKGSKLIGSFTLPSNADKMVVTFNTLSMLGADKTIGINAYAIDPNTARTALASRVNHHYLMRYGSLFASTFLAGFSSAIQSADTTITIGGTGGTTDTTVQNGINRSLLENALIGLGEVGKAWSETAQELMNRPTTVELFSGTGMGILFTQDVEIA